MITLIVYVAVVRGNNSRAQCTMPRQLQASMCFCTNVKLTCNFIFLNIVGCVLYCIMMFHIWKSLFNRFIRTYTNFDLKVIQSNNAKQILFS